MKLLSEELGLQMGEVRVILPDDVNKFNIPINTECYWVLKTEYSSVPKDLFPKPISQIPV